MRRRAGLIVVAAIVAIAAAACLPVKPAADRGAPADRPAVAGPPAGAPTGSQNGPLGSCSVFPPDNPWNTDVSNYPVSANSANYIANILSSGNQSLHPDFGGGGAYGIPYVTVGAKRAARRDQLHRLRRRERPRSVPDPARRPGRGRLGPERRPPRDRRSTVTRASSTSCTARSRRATTGTPMPAPSSTCARTRCARSGGRRPTRPACRSSPASCATTRSPTVRSHHALRFTVARTQNGYILPATHAASSSTDPNRPPMGLRLRLKASFDISRLHRRGTRHPRSR